MYRSVSIMLITALLTNWVYALDLRGVKGFGADATGGLGGRVLKVVSTASEGPGTLRWALQQKGPRVIVFEVGGVINLATQSLVVTEPNVTIAGETAPDPGVTLIRGGIAVRTHNVVISHLMVRPGDNNEAKRSGWESDGIAVLGAQAYDVRIDHCSLTWAVDENASASGPRDKGHAATSKRVTFSNNIIAEALDYATHVKGKHSKGMIVHDFVQDIAVVGNLFAHNDRRNPYFKAHTNGVVVNNLMYNLGNSAVQLGYVDDEFVGTGLTPRNPQVAVVGNVLIYGVSSFSDLPLVSYQGDAWLKDNIVENLRKQPMPKVLGDVKILSVPPRWPEGLNALPSGRIAAEIFNSVGARPWSRDAIDARIVASVRQRRGKIIDSQDAVGGYPAYKETRRALMPPKGNLAQWLASFTLAKSPLPAPD